MIRALLTAAACAIAAPAIAQAPKLGAVTQVEITPKAPNFGHVGWYALEFVYPIEQGDQFRIQVEPVKGAEMRLFWKVQKYTTAWEDLEKNLVSVGKIDATMTKGVPGKRARILVFSDSVGKVNVRISKVGDEPAADPKDEKIKKLEDENAALKKELAEMKAQLTDIKKLLEKKK